MLKPLANGLSYLTLRDLTTSRAQAGLSAAAIAIVVTVVALVATIVTAFARGSAPGTIPIKVCIFYLLLPWGHAQLL